MLTDDSCYENADPALWIEQHEHAQAIHRAWNGISEADRQEILRGRGRGPGRKEWHEAVGRFKLLFEEDER